MKSYDRLLAAIVLSALMLTSVFTYEMSAQNQRIKVTVSGHITDKASGETLIGAGVLTEGAGAATNNYGFYTLTIPQGRHLTLRYSYVGYDDTSVTLDLLRDTTINIALKANTELKEAGLGTKGIRNHGHEDERDRDSYEYDQEHPGALRRGRCPEDDPADAWRAERRGRIFGNICARRRAGREPASTGRDLSLQCRAYAGSLLNLPTGGREESDALQRLVPGTLRRKDFQHHRCKDK